MNIKKNLRLLIQTIVAIYILLIGVRFFIFIRAIEAGDISKTRPLGAEGFLPISALLGLKQLLFTGKYDVIHAAGLTIFLTAIVMSFIFKKSFCSHICPIGLASETVSKAGMKKKIPFFIPVWILKYILLGFFVYVVFIGMDLRSVEMFIQSPYNAVSDAKMMYLFLPPSRLTVIILLAIVGLTLIFRNFWCKYLCPYGALLGIVSLLSPIKIKRDKTSCTSCKRCTEVCPASIQIHTKEKVHNPDCMGCYDCINSCPVKGCLDTTTVSYRWYFSLIILGFFLLMIVVAMVFGFWESTITNEQYMRFLSIGVTHP